MDQSIATPTSVYRYYDEFGLLLYVGITSRGIKRNGEHNATKEWWQYVVKQDVEHHPTRRAAEDREASLIRKHQPPFNKVHNIAWRQARAAYVAMRHSKASPTSRRAIEKMMPADRRLLMGVEAVGSSIILTTRPGNQMITQAINLMSEEPLIVSSGGRKASVEMVYRTRRGQVAIRLACNGAESCLGADIVLRFDPKPRRGHPNELLSIKQVELDFGQKGMPRRSGPKQPVRRAQNAPKAAS